MDRTRNLAPIAPSFEISETVAATQAVASHVRTVVVPVQESPTPPADPAARRRFIQQRGW